LPDIGHQTDMSISIFEEAKCKNNKVKTIKTLNSKAQSKSLGMFNPTLKHDKSKPGPRKPNMK